MIEVDESVRRPELTAQFLSGDDFSGAFQAAPPKLARAVPGALSSVPAGAVPGCGIDLECTETDNSG